MRETELADEDSPSSLPMESLSIEEIPNKRGNDKEKEENPLQADFLKPIFLDYSRTESRLSKRRKGHVTAKGSATETQQLHDMFTVREIRYSKSRGVF